MVMLDEVERAEQTRRHARVITSNDERLVDTRLAPHRIVQVFNADQSVLPPKKHKGQYSIGEEIANSVTHGVGVLLGIAALVLMIVFAVRGGGGLKLVSAIVFGITLILEYLASTLYHAIQPPLAKRVLRVLDHSFIYILIAGSYTPFLLLVLLDHGGLLFLAIVWIIAAIGIVVEAFWREKPKWVNAVIYIAMGWLIVFKIPVIVQLLPVGCLWLLVAGGISYTLGTLFYVLKRVPYFHSIWHLFVLGGSICQFLAVLLYLL